MGKLNTHLFASTNMVNHPIDKAHALMIEEEIEELQDWRRQLSFRHRKTLTLDEHAAIGRNVQQIINLLKSKCA